MNITQVKQTIDYSIGAGGVTSPAWLPYLTEIASHVAGLVTIYGGAALILIRIAIAIREWMQNRGKVQ